MLESEELVAALLGLWGLVVVVLVFATETMVVRVWSLVDLATETVVVRVWLVVVLAERLVVFVE